MNNTQDFDGVFRFTNATTEDFTTLWNNKEYTFLAGTCSPIIIPDETPYSVESIRKKWAYKLAVREFQKSKEFGKYDVTDKIKPATYNDNVLQPWIDECLKPLPIARAEVKPLAQKTIQTKASKSITDKEDLNEVFKDEVPATLV